MFTVRNGYVGININGSNVLIKDNNISDNFQNIRISNNSNSVISENDIARAKNAADYYNDYGTWGGIAIHDTSFAIIKNNRITENVGAGIWTSGLTSPLIINNVFTGNQRGLSVYSAAIVKENIIISNGHIGIQTYGASPLYIHNQITGHDIVDISNGGGATPRMYFNTYDTVTNYDSSIIGKYNVTSNGADAPLQ